MSHLNEGIVHEGNITRKGFTFTSFFFIVGLAETCAASGSDFTVTQRLPSTFPELPAFHPEPAQVPFPEDLHGVSDRKLPNHDIL